MIQPAPDLTLDRYRGCLLGLAVGDAVGTTVEFSPPGTFEPVTDMMGGGPFDLTPGQWTDDTSMALCLGTSLLEKKGFDARDQMERYCAWRDRGYLSSTGRCFDIGNTVSYALREYKISGNPFSGSTSPRSAGNGSIMRLAPVPMYFAPDWDSVIHFSAESSRTTHGAVECIDACRLLGLYLARALHGDSKTQVLSSVETELQLCESIAALAAGQYLHKDQRSLTGSGYVVESLESALWCFQAAMSFEEAVLMAVNLGNDADTTGAICGQIAGAYYGESGIPDAWLEKLCQRSEIAAMAEALMRA